MSEIDRIAVLLLECWQRVDPKSGVALHPASYVATFADMARAIVADRETLTAENKRLREDLGCLAALLPSGAGARSRPDSDVIAFYITLRELRAARELARAAIGDAS